MSTYFDKKELENTAKILLFRLKNFKFKVY